MNSLGAHGVLKIGTIWVRLRSMMTGTRNCLTTSYAGWQIDQNGRLAVLVGLFLLQLTRYLMSRQLFHS
jgi:hypothetical protein